MYCFHLIGVTTRGIPFFELTQPASVRLHGWNNMYGSPRPSVTTSMTSSLSGAVSRPLHPVCPVKAPHRVSLVSAAVLYDPRPSRARGGSSFLGLARPFGAWFALALKLSEQPFRFICWKHAANLARRQQRHLVGGELVAVLVWP
jgi:hypothetical protein